MNCHRDHPLVGQFEILGAKPARGGKVFTIDGPSADAANSFEKPNEVAVTSRDASDIGPQFSFEFPPHSVTLLEIAV